MQSTQGVEPREFVDILISKGKEEKKHRKCHQKSEQLFSKESRLCCLTFIRNATNWWNISSSNNILIFNSSFIYPLKGFLYPLFRMGHGNNEKNLNFWTSQNSRSVDEIACPHTHQLKMFKLKWMANNSKHRIKRNVCVCTNLSGKHFV